jgi:hypothetical protein
MILRFFFCLLISQLILPLLAQERPRIIVDLQGDQHPWSSLEVNNAPGTFQFAIVTDRTGGHRPGVFPTAIAKLNLLQPEFVVSVGDLIEGYTDDRTQIAREWTEFIGFIDSLHMPFFYVPGNHDYINPVMAEEWKKRFGRDYYHFVYQDVLFLCLNSEERMRGAGRGYIDEPQLTYIREALAANPEVTWTLVFLHQPLWDQDDPGLWPEVEAALQDRPHTVFAGHRHRYVKYERNNQRYFVLATTGGGSSLRGPRFGEFDHVVWVTMTEQGPIIANLFLDGIWADDVNTEAFMAFSQPLLEQPALKPEPILIRPGQKTPDQLSLRLQNRSDVPMAYQLQFQSNHQLWLASDLLIDTLPPNQTLLKDIPLQGQSITLDSPPVVISGQLTYLPDGGPDLTVEQQYRLRPEPLYSITQHEVTVDANLTDWPELRFGSEQGLVDSDPFSHDGAADAAYRWDLSYDQEYVYFAADVTDDELILTEGGYPWTQDALGILVDARNLAQSAYNDGSGYFRSYLPLMVMPGVNEGDPGRLYNQDRMPAEIDMACRQTEKGYRVEVALPIAYVTQMQGDDWRYLRINVIQQDFDDGGDHESRLLWQPDWREDTRRTGAGMFEKVD